MHSVLSPASTSKTTDWAHGLAGRGGTAVAVAAVGVGMGIESGDTEAALTRRAATLVTSALATMASSLMSAQSTTVELMAARRPMTKLVWSRAPSSLVRMPLMPHWPAASAATAAPSRTRARSWCCCKASRNRPWKALQRAEVWSPPTMTGRGVVVVMVVERSLTSSKRECCCCCCCSLGGDGSVVGGRAPATEYLRPLLAERTTCDPSSRLSFSPLAAADSHSTATRRVTATVEVVVEVGSPPSETRPSSLAWRLCSCSSNSIFSRSR